MRALGHPFNLAPGRRELATTTDYNQIVRAQIIDSLMTNRNERVMRPRHGCDIQAALFDPSDELENSDAAAIIKSRLEAQVPRAAIRQVTIDSYGSQVTVTVIYRPSPYAEDVNLAVPVASEFLNRESLAQQRSIGS